MNYKMILSTEAEAKEWFAEISALGEYDLSLSFLREIEPNLSLIPINVINRIERLFSGVIDKSPKRNPLTSAVKLMRNEIASRRKIEDVIPENVKDADIIRLIKTGMKSEEIAKKLKCTVNNVVCKKRQMNKKPKITEDEIS